MKKISDYKGDSAIDLYAEILEPIGEIIEDKEVTKAMQEGKSMICIAGIAFRKHKEAVKKFILAVDGTELDGINVFPRFMINFVEVLNNKDFIDFFKQAEQMKTDSEFSGFAMANTKEKEN